MNGRAAAGIACIALALVFGGIGAYARNNPTGFVGACSFLQVCENESLPVLVDLVCDASDGSTCSMEALIELGTIVFPALIGHPGSRVRLWTVGENAASSELLHAIEFQASEPGPSWRADDVATTKLDRALLDLSAFDAYLSAPPPQQTPLLETIGKLTLSKPTKPFVHLVLIVSDGREVSRRFGDWECRSPAPDVEARVFDEVKPVMDSTSLSGASVNFVFFKHGTVKNRECDVPVARMRDIERTWRTVLRSAGATDVAFHVGPPAGLLPSS